MTLIDQSIRKGRKFDQVLAGARTVFMADGFEGAVHHEELVPVLDLAPPPDPRRVDELVDPPAALELRVQGVPRGARQGAHDRARLPKEPVEHRRLAHVGAALHTPPPPPPPVARGEQ